MNAEQVDKMEKEVKQKVEKAKKKFVDKSKAEEKDKKTPKKPKAEQTPSEWLADYTSDCSRSVAKHITKLLISGATLDEMVKSATEFGDTINSNFGRNKGAINQHLKWLEKMHGIEVVEQDGKFKIKV